MQVPNIQFPQPLLMYSEHLESSRRRACDICRKKRARCDGPYQPDMLCSNCVVYDFNCTYVEQPTRRAPSKKYIASLENRLEELEKVLRRLCPGDSIYEDWIESLTEETESPGPRGVSRTDSDLIKSLVHPSHHAHLEDDEDRSIIHASSLETNRFFGKSSEEMFVRTALSIKQQYIGGPKRPILTNRREEFWQPRPWEVKPDIISPRRYTFPDADLAKELVELYFSNINLYAPLLHRPSFERSLRDGLHYTTAGFANVYLLVCALGARFSPDPRVRPEGVDSQLSAGWSWYLQTETGKTPFFALPSLYDIQVACLRIAFIGYTSAPQAVWSLLGIAIRLAQDVGVHRRKTTTPTVEDELWKRAFWCLLYVDRIMSLCFGRPLSIQEEDFDLDMIIDCDDEYWDHPDPRKRFKQPPNKPSLITAFILQLRLSSILATCSRVIYPINKEAIHLGLVGKHGRANIVAELDSSLNQWLASVPDHLCWDPLNQPNDKFFNQSAALYAFFYFTQMSIHRAPMLSPKKRPSLAPSASLVISTNAARACIRVANAQLQRGVTAPSLIQLATFTSCLVLLLDMWAVRPGSRPSSSVEESPDMGHIRRGMEVLKACEHQYNQAGKFWDLISSLLPVNEYPDREQDLGAEKPSSSPSTPASENGESNEPTAAPDPAAQLALLQELLATTSGADENYWNVLRGLSHPYLSDEQHLPLPNLLPLGSSGSPASPLLEMGDNPASATTNPTDAHERPLEEGPTPGQLQGAAAMGDAGLDNTADLLDMWFNTPPELGLDDWHQHMASM